MIKLGITGGMGSGKSVVISFLKAMGIPVYIADDEAKRITANSPVVKKKLTDCFGDEIFEEGVLNKTLFASLIFGNEDKLKKANAVIHPEVLKDFLSWSEKQDAPIIAMESAILFESGFDSFVDKVICVTAPEELCIERAIKRSGGSREDALKRIANQIPEQLKIVKSDFVINNDGIEAITPQIEKAVRKIRP
ncbi:MAG: dephospho-CoA kinase [Dysgonamonadaceae bacterium]|jgi:dephospho-CoA kinase|nr:dephospho-CoA kinase [Dysgonamonadaceae bacterium]